MTYSTTLAQDSIANILEISEKVATQSEIAAWAAHAIVFAVYTETMESFCDSHGELTGVEIVDQVAGCLQRLTRLCEKSKNPYVKAQMRNFFEAQKEAGVF